jgi:hypothetical protein
MLTQTHPLTCGPCAQGAIVAGALAKDPLCHSRDAASCRSLWPRPGPVAGDCACAEHPCELPHDDPFRAIPARLRRFPARKKRRLLAGRVTDRHNLWRPHSCDARFAGAGPLRQQVCARKVPQLRGGGRMPNPCADAQGARRNRADSRRHQAFGPHRPDPCSSSSGKLSLFRLIRRFATIGRNSIVNYIS